MPTIRLELVTESSHLTAAGYIHRAPVEQHPEPAVSTQLAVRRTVQPVVELSPGYYAFAFKTMHGSGAFTLRAVSDGSGAVLRSKDYRGVHGGPRTFSFVVVPDPPRGDEA